MNSSRLLRINTLMMALFAVFGFTLNTFSQVQIGQDIDGQYYDQSGYSISMPDANTMAIGAPLNSGNGLLNAGNVRVYTWNGTSWVQKGVNIVGEVANDRSGYSVSMPDANTVAIGAPYNDGTGSSAGHVRIYKWNGTTWVQKGIDIDGEAADDNSGYTVSMPDANTVAIGAIHNDGSGPWAGHVRVYTWNGTTWAQKGLDIDGEAPNDESGFVSMPDANTVAIGAIKNDGNGIDAGHVRIYEWNGTAWLQKGIDIDGEVTGDQAGRSISMPDANTVAIGAFRNDGNGTDAGHVRIYEWNGTSWAQKGIDIVGALGDYLGRSVSMPDANTVAIGATGYSGNGSSSGQVQIYAWNGTAWVQKGIDINGEAAGDNWGFSVSMPEANILGIGSPFNDDNGTDAGHVRVFKLKGVQGLVYNDMNQNCINDEQGVLVGILGIVEPGNIIVETASNGVWYIIDSLPIGNYTISYDTIGNWLATCPNPMSFTVTNPDDLTQIPSFGMVNTNPCAEPNISIHMPFIRPGFSNQTVYVSACNAITGTAALNDASVVVSLDELLTVDAASISYTNLGNNTFSFEIDTLFPGQCVNFTISTTLSTSATLSQTLCMEALLFHVDSCVLDYLPAPTPPDFTPCNLPWDNSSISVEGECVNDSIVFTITNTGDPGNGDMDCYSPIRLYIDGVYIWLDSIQLNGGNSFTYSFAGDGRTWRLEVDQHPLHPGNSNPNASIELCGNSANWIPDIVNILPHDDLDPIKDIYCGIVTGSYDPNDKKGLPGGVGNDHLIAPNGKIDYVIRFQNTGTDTAFTVVIRDTLDTDLDIFSVKSGVASHAYSFRMHGPRVLEWTFNNILLPDSTTNEPASNGFITFTVNQIQDLPDGTEINNTGNIYFDFNEPIITNTTSHIIGREVKTASWTEEIDITSTSCDEYVHNGLTYIKTGSYYQVIEGVSTDTLVTLNVIINNSTVDTDIQVACDSLTWIDGITYTASNNTATYTLTNTAGCDSVMILDLTINTVSDVSTTLTGITITANNSVTSYKWFDCDNNFAPISGETAQSFTPIDIGNYAVELSENGCLDTSVCVVISSIWIIENGKFILFPNPTNGEVKIVFENYQQELNVSIFSVTGQLLEHKTFQNSDEITVDIKGPAGVYFLKLNSNNLEETIRVVKD